MINRTIIKSLLALAVFCCSYQAVYAQNNSTNQLADINFASVLNAPDSFHSLAHLKKKLTLLDFFGTWCLPCLRALPHLKELKEKYPADLDIVLVSNETRAQLEKFIKGRPGFSFPVIVDESNALYGFFQPPSLPFTVALDQDGKVIEVITADSIGEAHIHNLLIQPVSKLTIEPSSHSKNMETNTNRMSSNTLVKLSQEYIYAAKTGATVDSLIQQLKNISYQNLMASTSREDDKKTFWINLYNGFTQAALKAHPELYRNRKSFFGSKNMDVAGLQLSPDEIEHGILRHSMIKWSLGHLHKIFAPRFEKELRVKSLDYRIHFALNCGAKSCPPIAFYQPETLNAQLDMATKAYLQGEANYNPNENIVFLPAIMGWFRGDFGGKKGMIEILRKFGIIPMTAHPKIKFKKYDWSLSLNNEII